MRLILEAEGMFYLFEALSLALSPGPGSQKWLRKIFVDWLLLFSEGFFGEGWG